MHGSGKLPDSGDVHVWFVELTASAAALATYSNWLSPDEGERASRFRFEHLRSDFTLSRGILRLLLGHYLAAEPGRIRFEYGQQGKPAVADPASSLVFNLSHSGAFAAYAFAVECTVGLDVEEVRPMHDAESIVRRFFSPEECQEWLDIPASERDEAFFRCWTRKEAYIKAIGDGLSMPLNSFSVSVQSGKAESLVRSAGESYTTWLLHSLQPAEGYVGALAVPAAGCSVRVLPCLSAQSLLELAERSALPAHIPSSAHRRTV
jgi:4'-phosphopantetheinyl transferase